MKRKYLLSVLGLIILTCSAFYAAKVNNRYAVLSAYFFTGGSNLWHTIFKGVSVNASSFTTNFSISGPAYIKTVAGAWATIFTSKNAYGTVLYLR